MGDAKCVQPVVAGDSATLAPSTASAPYAPSEISRLAWQADASFLSLQSLIDVLPDYFWIKDRDKRFTVVNKALALTNGFSQPAEMLGLSDFDIYSRSAAETFHADDEAVINSGSPLLNKRELISDSGAEKWVLTTKFALRNQDEEVIGVLGVARDISEAVRADNELIRAREFWHMVVEQVPNAIIIKDVRTRRYTMLNRAAETLIGKSRIDVLGKTASSIYSKSYCELVEREDELLLEKGELQIEDHEMQLDQLEPRIVNLKRKILTDEAGEPQFMLAVFHDVTERKRSEEKIARLARHDTMTGLFNRSMFNDRLARVIKQAEDFGAGFAVLTIDLDRLKEVNDMFGHAAGDRLITQVATRMSEAARGEFVARIGGDEFAMIVEKVENMQALGGYVKQLNDAVNQQLTIEDVKYDPSICIGVAIYPQDGCDQKSLLANADAALYRAKADGRNIARFFEPNMDLLIRERRALRQDLNFAIERNELLVYYQPNAKLNGEIFGFEALLRWKHPTRGWVPPSEFIPAAEESRSIVEIGEWVLRDVCREACKWPLQLGVAVNLSPVQFHYGDLTNLVHSILLETGLAADRLALEITEGVLISDSARALTVLRQLKALGVRIVMDDFGKGYSSLSYLQLFPFDKIKIDREFVHNVCQNRQSAAIVRAVLGLAGALGLPVLAEGVETEEEREFLRALGCDEMQGYLIGRPGPIENYAQEVGRPSLLSRVAANAR